MYSNLSTSSRHQVADIEEKCAMNELRLSGNFTLMDMHHWMSLCLPDVPVRPASHDSCLYNYKSTFLGTVLQCAYSKGQAKFRSDSITTISVVRDTMSREATARKIQLGIQVDVLPYLLLLTSDFCKRKIVVLFGSTRCRSAAVHRKSFS